MIYNNIHCVHIYILYIYIIIYTYIIQRMYMYIYLYMIIYVFIYIYTYTYTRQVNSMPSSKEPMRLFGHRGAFWRFVDPSFLGRKPSSDRTFCRSAWQIQTCPTDLQCCGTRLRSQLRHIKPSQLSPLVSLSWSLFHLAASDSTWTSHPLRAKVTALGSSGPALSTLRLLQSCRKMAST